MQPAPKAPRTPANGHDTFMTGARRIPPPSGQCENRPSHQTQYRRFHEIVHALGVNYQTHTRPQAEVIVDTAIFCPSRPKTAVAPGQSVRNKRHRRCVADRMPDRVLSGPGLGSIAGLPLLGQRCLQAGSSLASGCTGYSDDQASAHRGACRSKQQPSRSVVAGPAVRRSGLVETKRRLSPWAERLGHPDVQQLLHEFLRQRLIDREVQ